MPYRLVYFFVFAGAGLVGSLLVLPVTLALGQSLGLWLLVWVLMTAGGGAVLLAQELAERSLKKRDTTRESEVKE